MARATIAIWFNSNTPALKAAQKMRVDGSSWRAVVTQLRSDFKFPFRDHTALMDFAAAGWPLPKPLVASTPSSTVIQVESFKRTKADLRALEKCETFFCTSAVNNCEANADFVQAALHWCDDHDAKLLINKVRYKNPTRRDDAALVGEWWDRSLRDYMLEQEIRPHPLVSIMTMKAQATAGNPLPRRADALTKDRSAIFGHPQLSLRTVATPHLEEPKVLYSTGACTNPWYSDTVAGELGGFHHSISGVAVEVRGDAFFLREMVWNTREKCFIDIDTLYDADGSRPAPPARALVMGDIHVRLTCDDVMHATFGPGGIYESARPEEIVLHDVFNGDSVNPHEMENKLTRAAMSMAGLTNVEQEVRDVMAWLDALPTDCKRTVVRSNHDEFLDRWLQKGERVVEPENRLLYHELSALLLRGYDEKTRSLPQALATAIEHLGGLETEVEFLGVNDAHRILRVVLGMHGNRASSGTRGTPVGLSRLGSRGMYGHLHAMAIWQGAHIVGHSSRPRHGYNNGPSPWVRAHGLLDHFGYRQMLMMRGREYRG